MDKDKLAYFVFGFLVALYAINPRLLSPLLLWGVVAYGSYFILKYFSDRNQSQRKSEGTRVKKRENRSRRLDYFPSNDQLLKEIRTLTGSEKVARRLLRLYRQKYPGQSEQWRKEKIIYDVKRDRGGI